MMVIHGRNWFAWVEAPAVLRSLALVSVGSLKPGRIVARRNTDDAPWPEYSSCLRVQAFLALHNVPSAMWRCVAILR